MHIVIFTHPVFLGSQSMPRYAKMLADGLKERNHTVEIWTAQKFLYRLPLPFKKWLGYFDQFVVFPMIFRRKLDKTPKDSLFVFSDHGIGPWIPPVSGRPHIVHCHDFLAQRSALGEISENRVKFSGKLYQKWIRKGYRKGENFISISKKTQEDLHRFLGCAPRFSEVIYNGLNQDFRPGNTECAREHIEEELNVDLKSGFILHVGGNQFYKNRNGTMKIYDAWRKRTKKKLPLLMIGPTPTKKLEIQKENSFFSSSIHFLSNVSDDFLKLCYQGASVFLFPSLEEGFGWPIAEAMASGCPVITTNRAPMNEVGSDCCFYIPRKSGEFSEGKWAAQCSDVLEQVLDLSKEDRRKTVEKGVENAKRFNTDVALGNIESLYKKVLKSYQKI